MPKKEFSRKEVRAARKVFGLYKKRKRHKKDEKKRSHTGDEAASVPTAASPSVAAAAVSAPSPVVVSTTLGKNPQPSTPLTALGVLVLFAFGLAARRLFGGNDASTALTLGEDLNVVGIVKDQDPAQDTFVVDLHHDAEVDNPTCFCAKTANAYYRACNGSPSDLVGFPQVSKTDFVAEPGQWTARFETSGGRRSVECDDEYHEVLDGCEALYRGRCKL